MFIPINKRSATETTHSVMGDYFELRETERERERERELTRE